MVGCPYASSTASALPQAEIVGVGNVVLDITERKEAEEFRGVVMDNLAEGVFALDADGRVAYRVVIVDAEKAGLDRFGRSRRR